MRNLSHRGLSNGVVDAVDANWCKSDRCCDLVLQQLHRVIAGCRINERARDDPVAIEGHAVGLVRPANTGIAGKISHRLRAGNEKFYRYRMAEKIPHSAPKTFPGA